MSSQLLEHGLSHEPMSDRPWAGTLFRSGARALFVIQIVGSLVLAIILIRSAGHHLSNPYAFLASVYRYDLLPVAAARAMAMVLPVLELLTAVCLVGRIFVGGALVTATALFGSYAAAQASALWRGLEIPCGCSGPSVADPVSAGTLAWTGGLFVLSLASCASWNLMQRGSTSSAAASPEIDVPG